jgi:hypothetical protein
VKLEPLTIVIRREVPSLNKTMWRHRMAYVKERDHWLALIRAQLVPRRARPDHQVRAVISSLRGRIIDFTNLVGGAKAIEDALKRLGYIHDDSPSWWVCDYQQRVVPRPLRCTRIHLEPA